MINKRFDYYYLFDNTMHMSPEWGRNAAITTCPADRQGRAIIWFNEKGKDAHLENGYQ